MLEPRAGDGLLLCPLGGVVGDSALSRRTRPERAHQHESIDAFVLRGSDEILRSLRHHAFELCGAAPDDRHQVHHVRATRDSLAEARRVSDVARGDLDPERAQVVGALGPADERADVAVLRAQRVHDPAAQRIRSRR